MKKKEECMGCIGLSDEHTCEGYAQFLAMKAEKDKCQNCKRLTDEIRQLRSRNDDLIESLDEAKYDEPELRSKLDKQRVEIRQATEAIRRLKILALTSCEAPKDCIGPLVPWDSATQNRCNRCERVRATCVSDSQAQTARAFLVELLLHPMSSSDHMTHCDKTMGDSHPCTCGANDARTWLSSAATSPRCNCETGYDTLGTEHDKHCATVTTEQESK